MDSLSLGEKEVGVRVVFLRGRLRSVADDVILTVSERALLAHRLGAAPTGRNHRMATTIASDLDILLGLNRDYIRSVQNSDVRRFDEILADDFRCTNPDGTLLDREAFLKQTARPV